MFTWAQPCQRQMPQHMGNWQANHQLKLRSQSEAEQCTWYSGPQVDVRVIAVTLCLIWCYLLSSPGLRHWECTCYCTCHGHSIFFFNPLELTPQGICLPRSLDFVPVWCLSSSQEPFPPSPVLAPKIFS